MTVFFLIVFGLYLAGLVVLWIGWMRSMRTPSHHGEAVDQKISLIVPFRNEEKNLANIIRDIHAQRISGGGHEVILVDDHSTDRSFMIAGGLTSPFSEFKVIQLPEDKHGKKLAIQEGIAIASGSIIVTTDADCRLPDSWLTALRAQFANEKIKMVFGGVRMKATETFFSRLQAIEFCSLVGTGAATSALRVPLLCNGASLAYRKSSFIDVNGFEGNLDVASGDDEFLMHKIHRRFPGSVHFLPDRDAVVETLAQESVAAFVNQRLRWAGKWKRSGSITSQLIALFLLLVHWSYIILFFSVPWSNNEAQSLYILTFAVFVRFYFELFLYWRVGKFLRVKLDPFAFLFLVVIYPFYVIFIGVASLVVSPDWKGRR